MVVSGPGVNAGDPILNNDLDDRARSLACLGAAIVRGASLRSLRWLSDRARRAGATGDEIIGTLLVVAPIVGTARLPEVAPKLAAAAGYDIETALEMLD